MVDQILNRGENHEIIQQGTNRMRGVLTGVLETCSVPVSTTAGAVLEAL